ncbi:MAG: MFS transporter [Lactobacillus sp.]|nr:MAG: MFS transporter [Lactobacillus sp.]
MFKNRRFRFFQPINDLSGGGTSLKLDPDTLSPETGKPFTKATTTRYLVAFIVYAMLNNMAFTINGNTLLPQHLKDVGMANPTAAFGIITSVTSLVSLFAGYIWGTLSDKTKSRWGKRTPWIFCGSIVAGIGLCLLGVFSTTITLTGAYILNTLGNNAIQTPMYAFLADRVPKNVRGTLSAGFGATAIGGPIGQFISSFFLGKPYQQWGFVVGAVIIACSGLVALLIIPKERPSRDANTGSASVKESLLDLLPPSIKGAHNYYKACVGRFLMMTSGTMIGQYLLYILENYIGQTTLQAAATINKLSLFTLITSTIGLAISGPLSDRIKRRKVPILFAAILIIAGTLTPLIMKSTTGVIVYTVLAGLGTGVYSSVDGALNVDVIPEFAKENKITGKYVGFGNLTNTMGQMVAPAATSFIVTITAGYDLAFIVSVIFAVVGVSFIMSVKGIK